MNIPSPFAVKEKNISLNGIASESRRSVCFIGTQNVANEAQSETLTISIGKAWWKFDEC